MQPRPQSLSRVAWSQIPVDVASATPGDCLNGDITDYGRQDRRDQPPAPWHPHSVGGCDHRAENERYADDEHPCERDVRIRVSHTAEDRMIVEQSLEPGDIHTHREDQQQEGKGDGKSTPR